jgi:hypothetical protein
LGAAERRRRVAPSAAGRRRTGGPDDNDTGTAGKRFGVVIEQFVVLIEWKLTP